MVRPLGLDCKENQAICQANLVGGLLLLVALLSIGLCVKEPMAKASEQGESRGFGALPTVVAPFSADDARTYQKQWADHLGVPIERTNSLGMRLVLIPPGQFEMGATDEEIQLAVSQVGSLGFPWVRPLVRSEGPRHRIRITRPLFFGGCEVTIAQFRRFVEATSYQTEAQRDRRVSRDGRPIQGQISETAVRDDGPVTHVTWNDALAFCQWLSRQEDAIYRLPTEAEWEYACRAGTETPWSFGDRSQDLAEHAWYAANSKGGVHPVGQKKPNAWGLFDLHGNVSEWCADWMAKDYKLPPSGDDSTGASSGYWRIYRGGAWDSAAVFTRSAFRIGIPPDVCNDALGFRVVCQLAASPDTRRAVPNAPPLAVAPFAAAEASQYQERWAAHLRQPVEQENSLGMKLRLIPPGRFLMGATPQEINLAIEQGRQANELPWYFERVATEGPQHQVTISRPFFLGICEVTQKEYDLLMGNDQPERHAATRPYDSDRWPAQFVSWEDSLEFCRRLSNLPKERQMQRSYRLPTEAEWEYACRAGSTTAFGFGEDWKSLREYGWFKGNSSSQPHEVGQKKPNAWGLYDMHGNLWEWCSDRWADDYYQKSTQVNPAGPLTGEGFVFRGGAFMSGAYSCRSACRLFLNPKDRSSVHGFRIVCEVPEPEQVK